MVSIEWEPQLPVIPFSSLALPEAFDFLDTCWRLAFGKRRALLRLKNATDTAMLSLPCATRDEFGSRLSALANIFKSMDVPDELLPPEKRQLPKDQAFTRLLACLEPCLDTVDSQACYDAIRILRAVNDIRTSFQHSVTARELPAVLRQLDIPYPFPPWGETWDRIRAKTVEALGVIRDKIRSYANSGRSDTYNV